MQMEKRIFCVKVIICVHFARWPMKIKVREMVEPVGGFFEVYVSTPIEVCEQRDPPLQRGVRGDFVGATVPVAMPLIPIPLFQMGELAQSGICSVADGSNSPLGKGARDEAPSGQPRRLPWAFGRSRVSGNAANAHAGRMGWTFGGAG